jgi:meso-butanediol dehydrogenase/(S,S)-butanediol dehydrogenase/diacetyl reductase
MADESCDEPHEYVQNLKVIIRRLKMYDFAGKVAIVTGTSRRKGIGCAIALRLARDGADVVVNDRPIDPNAVAPWDKDGGWQGLPSVVKEIEALGRRGLAITADVTKRQQVNDMVAEAVKKFGHIDILVNNHKFFDENEEHALSRRFLVNISEELFDKYINVNLKGTFLMCQAVGNQMIKQGQGGKIINIDSLAGKRARPGMGAYSASKAGILKLTEALALELGQYNINVNAVCPGATATWGTSGKAITDAMKQGLSEEEAIKKVYTKSGQFPQTGALGRPGRPEDQANAVAFLASSDADFITGQAINVCGGQLVGI